MGQYTKFNAEKLFDDISDFEYQMEDGCAELRILGIFINMLTVLQLYLKLELT